MHPYFARFGVCGAQWGVLRNLHRAEEEGCSGLRLTDLGRRLRACAPSVTGIAHRLEKAGLIVRRASETDGRSDVAALTVKGRRCVEAVLAGYPSQVARLVSGLSGEEQEQLACLLVRLNERLAALAEGADG